MNKPNIVIFLGPPGSGKGSLSNLAIKNMGFNQISTGNLCRHHIANATDIGKQIDVIIKAGKLISDELITNMVFDWLGQQVDKFSPIILDGYPRTVNQAIALEAFVKEFINLVAKKLDIKISWKGKGINEKGYDENGSVIIESHPSYFRPSEVDTLLGDYSKAKKKLGWEPVSSIIDLVNEMVDHDLKNA